MKLTVLVVLVALQVVVFQFLAVRLSRVLPDYLVGARGAAARDGRRHGRYRRRLGRAEWSVGVVLLLVLGLAVTAAAGPAVREARGRGSLARIGSRLSHRLRPGSSGGYGLYAGAVRRPPKRTATLERGRLSRHYGISGRSSQWRRGSRRSCSP